MVVGETSGVQSFNIDIFKQWIKTVDFEENLQNMYIQYDN